MKCSGGEGFTDGDPGFTNLIGQDLTGWTVMNMPESEWSVKDGMLQFSGKGQGWIRTNNKYKNFALRAEWCFGSSPYDSGLYILAGTDGSPYPTVAYQLQMAGSSEGLIFPNASITGAVSATSTIHAPPAFNRWEVTVQDGAVTLDSNGVRVYSAQGVGTDSGYIGWQAEDHALGVRKTTIKELN